MMVNLPASLSGSKCGPGSRVMRASSAGAGTVPCGFVGASPAGAPCMCVPARSGLGQLFGSTDIADWGWGEWLALAAGAWLLFSLFQGSQRVAGRVRSAVSKRGRRSRRRRELERRLAEV
jgi:hypothetical protein